MHERRNHARRAGAGLAGAVAWSAFRLWAKAAKRPLDAVAILGAGAVSLFIVVNAVFMQSGSHPAPFFANPAPPVVTGATSATAPAKSAGTIVTSRPLALAHGAQTVSVRHDDPIADLIGSSVGSPARVMIVQRVLSEFGYGQIKPSGTLDRATSAAIERFERDHKMPVTGRLSDRLLSELGAMSGRRLE